MAKKILITRKALNSFIPKFNADHNFTKIVGVKTDLVAYGKGQGQLMCWVLDVRVGAHKDGRKKLCNFRLNVWPKEDTLESVSETINDMYRGMRQFLDNHDGLEEQAITKKQEEEVLA